MQENKSLGKAYAMTFLGLLLGFVGVHRLYLGYTASGMAMLLTLLAGISLLVYGYALIYFPVIEGLISATSGNVNFSNIPDLNQLKEFGKSGWFYAGYVLCGASLLWLLIDLLRMPTLVRRANDLHNY